MLFFFDLFKLSLLTRTYVPIKSNILSGGGGVDPSTHLCVSVVCKVDLVLDDFGI